MGKKNNIQHVFIIITQRNCYSLWVVLSLLRRCLCFIWVWTIKCRNKNRNSFQRHLLTPYAWEKSCKINIDCTALIIWSGRILMRNWVNIFELSLQTILAQFMKSLLKLYRRHMYLYVPVSVVALNVKQWSWFECYFALVKVWLRGVRLSVFAFSFSRRCEQMCYRWCFACRLIFALNRPFVWNSWTLFCFWCDHSVTSLSLIFDFLISVLSACHFVLVWGKQTFCL